MTNPYFIQATFQTCFFIPFSYFNDEKIKLKDYKDYNKQIATCDNSSVQSHDQEESKLNSSINRNWCSYTYTQLNNNKISFNKNNVVTIKTNEILTKILLLGPVEYIQWS